METRTFKTEIKWLFLAIALTVLSIGLFDGGALFSNSRKVPTYTFLELHLFLEILVFFVFNIFVVFGIKGFFEKYSQKFANGVILLSGASLTVVVFFLSYQMLFVR